MTAPMDASAGGGRADGQGTRGIPGRVLLIAGGAVLLRILLLVGRGDYLAFDEGWYLLLARSLYTGDGYSLVGFPHTALSPLFPILAGGVGAALDSWVWGGRLVAAVASGLVVLPAWAIFRRLAPDRTALIGAGLVAVLPSMAPFVVPFWIGADLWVGAEPLLHLFLYLGVAMWLRADELEGDRTGGSAGDGRDADDTGSAGSPAAAPRPWARPLAWLATGVAFGLAFLARPEAIITWGLLGIVALGLALVDRSRSRLAGATLMGLGFLILGAPYWLYIHDVSGQWRLTGRGVSLPTPVVTTASGQPGRSTSARTIERMLWQDDEAYRDRLYGLDPSGLRLRSDYWGVRPPVDVPAEAPDAAPSTRTEPRTAPEAAAPRAPPVAPGPVDLYRRAMGQILPLLLWLFTLLGMAQPRGRAVLRRELPVAGALLGTSAAIAAVVAVDPRTQLFLVPLLALYAARGFRLVDETLRRRWPDGPRPGFVELLLAAVAVTWLLGIDGRRLYLSVTLGSPHHVVGAQNRAVAEELDELLAPGASVAEAGGGPGEARPVASWHPAIAVYADRDWRVLPFAGLPEIVRYLDAAGAEAFVLSAYYPPDLGVEELNTRYLILPVPDADGPPASWQVRLLRGDSIRAVGRLEPAG